MTALKPSRRRERAGTGASPVTAPSPVVEALRSLGVTPRTLGWGRWRYVIAPLTVAELRPAKADAATVFLDYAEHDWPTPCPSCRAWRAERVTDESGARVLREWHHEDCTTYLEWA